MKDWCCVLVGSLLLTAVGARGQKVNQRSWNDLVVRKRISTTMLAEGELSYRILQDNE